MSRAAVDPIDASLQAGSMIDRTRGARPSVACCSNSSSAATSMPLSSSTHRITLEVAPAMYRAFRDKEHACIKVVMTP
jgi:threonine dehydrogenase-like Zn-dependent dehydrogenase